MSRMATTIGANRQLGDQLPTMHHPYRMAARAPESNYAIFVMTLFQQDLSGEARLMNRFREASSRFFSQWLG